jgi:hypothetical protein
MVLLDIPAHFLLQVILLGCFLSLNSFLHILHFIRILYYMPLTSKGKKILNAMQMPSSEGGYGSKKGKEVFYASANKGTIKGVHKGKKKKRGWSDKL